MICTFFGHADAPKEIEPVLRSALIRLVQEEKDILFYVGNQGNFDAMVRRVLAELSRQYPIRYFVVLPYLPKKEPMWESERTILPEGLETVPPRFAIDHRNRWMLRRADIIVTYVTRPFGGAAKCKQEAKRKHKTVLDLFDRGLQQ